MDLEFSTVHVTYPPGWRLIVAVLVLHTIISVLRRLSAWHRRVPVGEGAVAEAVFPLFIGLCSAWIGSYNLSKGIRFSGGGPASSAAGAAEAQALLLLACVVAAVLAALMLGAHVSARRHEVSPMSTRPALLTGLLVAFASLVTAELLFCASIQAGRPPSETTEVLAASAAFGCLALSVALAVRAYRRGSPAAVHPAAIAAVFVVSSSTALTLWYLARSWQRIAMGAV